MNIRRLLAPVFVAAALLSSSTTTTARSSADADSPVQIVDAVWRQQSLDFAYNGSATYYSCDTLRDRLRTILKSVGARDTLTIRFVGCSDMSFSTRVQITFEAPVEATPENVRAITSYDSKDVLVARVRNEQLDSSADIERFPAMWKTISFSRDRELDLAPADCELVQQLHRQVFPRLSIRVVRENLRCSTVFPNLGQPQLSVAALVAAPRT